MTTTGRRTGEPHTIEIWFAAQASSIYMLASSGERADWVRNLRKEARVDIRIGDEQFVAQARIVQEPDEDATARRLLLEKYSPGYSGDLTNWGRTALPVTIDLPDE